jgi:RHS repeat-associated protein
VYDAFGRLVIEYLPEAASTATSYYTQDHLGSTRLETNASGQQVKCSDYVPFGEEIPAGYGGRPSCFNSNDNRIKYTGKERDGETGLDYFLARYYSGAQGRFTSPDPLMASAYIADPQTWNRYAYVRNDPINMVDPYGMDGMDPSVYLYNQSYGWINRDYDNWWYRAMGNYSFNDFNAMLISSHIDITIPGYAGVDPAFLGYLKTVDDGQANLAKNGQGNDHGVEITVSVISGNGADLYKGKQQFQAIGQTMENDVFFQFGAGAAAMFRNFDRMKEVGWIGADKYYHCMGNCQAANYGPGGSMAAKILSFLRTGIYSRYWNERGDWQNDDRANKCGQRGGDCDKVCKPLVPQSSPGNPPFPGW